GVKWLSIIDRLQSARDTSRSSLEEHMATNRVPFGLEILRPKWGWAFFDGIVTLALGILIWAEWPWSGLWFLGLSAPRVFGRELEIHPLLAILTLMIGAAVGGFAGAYLSLPIAAVVRVVWTRFGHSSAQQVDSEATLSFSYVKGSELDLCVRAPSAIVASQI